MAAGQIPYYRVSPKNQRAYWCPTKSMQLAGFDVATLGPDGPEAKAAAIELNERWQKTRRERRDTLGPRQLAEPRFVELRPPRAKSCVYFLQCGDRVKIGVSYVPFSRVSSLAGGAHAPLTKAVIVPGTRGDEKKLHRRFASYRANGEWFVASRPLLLTIARCAMAGQVVHDEGERGTPESKHPPFFERLESNRQLLKGELSA